MHHSWWELLTVGILILSSGSICEHHHLHVLHLVLHVGVRVHACWETHLLRHHHLWELTHLLHVLLSHVELGILLHHILWIVLHSIFLRIDLLFIVLSEFVLAMGEYTTLTKFAIAVF